MKNNTVIYTKRLFIPYLLLSLVAGAFTGGMIFLFKLAVSAVTSLSSYIYTFPRENVVFLPLLVFGAALVGLLAAMILKFDPKCRGGGIPTAIAVIKGLVPFNWIKSVFLLFPSALLTYLCGVPLGTEGPSVQMGTAIGRGSVRIFAKKYPAWDRYIMTGGACAGFAAATGAPLTGIFFAFEEAHRRFSPMIFTVASMSVISSTAVMQFLCSVSGVEYSLFGFTIENVLPLKFMWSALVVGVACGVCAVLCAKLYRALRKILQKYLGRVPFILKIITVFVAVSLIGCASHGFIGSGHSFVDELIEGKGIWYMLIIYLCIRVILILISNNIGVTGGLFVPTLALGAIIGALCAKLMTMLGLLPEEYYVIIVVVGIASFLCALSRIPLTAIIFSCEALCGLSNMLGVVVGVSVAYLVVESFGGLSFTDVVIESKAYDHHIGKSLSVVDTQLTVANGSFVVGKEIRDLLLPPSCVILSVHKNFSTESRHGTALCAGDILHVHYQTYDPAQTLQMLEELVGKQSSEPYADTHPGDENDSVPEL